MKRQNKQTNIALKVILSLCLSGIVLGCISQRKPYLEEEVPIPNADYVMLETVHISTDEDPHGRIRIITEDIKMPCPVAEDVTLETVTVYLSGFHCTDTLIIEDINMRIKRGDCPTYAYGCGDGRRGAMILLTDTDTLRFVCGWTVVWWQKGTSEYSYPVAVDSVSLQKFIDTIESFESGPSGYEFRRLRDWESKNNALANDILAKCDGKPEIGRIAGTFTDARDGKTYSTVEIGKQTWMVENLNYQTDSSWCYGNNDSNCVKYGRLYNWNTAMKICPAGWHLPDTSEWERLITFVGGGKTAGVRLKSESLDCNYGFSALLGGGYYNGSFYALNSWGGWWSVTESKDDVSEAHYWLVTADNGTGGLGRITKSFGFSVRCLQD
jgi:uncharacterized protein (TIGR02145 family)